MCRIWIEVTRDDIRRGAPRSSWACPIALAIKRLFPEKYVTVGDTTIVIGKRTFLMPPLGRAFVKEFDEDPNRFFSPPSFYIQEITLPSGTRS